GAVCAAIAARRTNRSVLACRRPFAASTSSAPPRSIPARASPARSALPRVPAGTESSSGTMARLLVVAGTSTGVGKTSITLGLLDALRCRGLRVQAFKIGPDFIDPGFHELVTGRPSYNLDGWMCGRERVLACVARHAAGADVGVVEGVMGCFDGFDGPSEAGSTPEVAQWVRAPRLLLPPPLVP